MNTIDIENMLLQYLDKKSKMLFKQKDIEALKEKLRYGGCSYIETKEEAIEGLSIQAVTISDMPANHSGNIHSIVETATLHYQDEMKNPDRLTDFEVRDIKRKIEKIEAEMIPLRDHVNTVDIWMQSLKYEEKFIVEHAFIQDLKWPYVETFYYEKFREHRTVDRLQKIGNKAIYKMLYLAS
jgi:hypothetical protein